MRRKNNKNKKENKGGHKKRTQWGNLSEVTEVPHIITPGGPIGRPGAMQGKPLRGKTATAHGHTTDTSIAAPRTSPTGM